MMLITGATGNIGSELVRLLAARGTQVRALARKPPQNLPAAVELAIGDLDRPETLRPALAGVDVLFLLSPGLDIPAQDRAAIAEAVRAGVRRIVMVSSGGVTSETGSGPLHAPGEAALRASGVAWTILRPSEFMSNALMWLGTIRDHGAFYQSTGDGRSAMIHPHDIAAVAAHVLTTPGHDGAIYELTGPAALSRADVAAALSEAAGRAIRFVDIPDSVAREELVKAGLPPFLVDPIAKFAALVKTGGAAEVHPTVAQLTGTPPRTFADWARANASLFR